MRPLTDNLPKPLLEIMGKPILGHCVDHLIKHGVTKIIVNGFHAIEPLKEYIKEIQSTYPKCEFFISEEKELLETGGGIVKGLDFIDTTQPLFIINGDAFWVDYETQSSLLLLENKWDKNLFDILLLLQNKDSMHISDSVGDYNLDGDRAVRDTQKNGQYMFSGIRICNPRILKHYPLEKFSFLKMMDDAQARGKLGGLIHKGEWYHISTPQDLNDTNRLLKDRLQ
jgi:MurNAc alpha-1-phosphate uridylyltransferase